MPPQTLQEQLKVDLTELLVRVVLCHESGRRTGRLLNPPVQTQEVAPGIVIQIDGNLWLQSHKNQEALLRHLLERAQGYPWYANVMRLLDKEAEIRRVQKLQHQQQGQLQQSSSTLAGQPGTSQEPSYLASAGQRSTNLPTSHSSSASLPPQIQAVNARQRDMPFEQAVQQLHQPSLHYHGGLASQSQQQSAHQRQGSRTQGSTLPSIQGLDLQPRQAQTQSSVRGPQLPPMQFLQSDPSAPLVAARGHPQGSKSSVAPAGRLPFPDDILAKAQACAVTTAAAGSRPQITVSQPVCENCGMDIKLCSCASGDEDEFLIVEARKIEMKIQKMEEKHEQIRATGAGLKVKEAQKKRDYVEATKRTLQRAEKVKEARRNRNARLAQEAATAESKKREEQNSQEHRSPTVATRKERTSSLSHQAPSTSISKPAVSEAGGRNMPPDNSTDKAKPDPLTLSRGSRRSPIVPDEELSGRHDDTQLSSPALVRGSASQGQSVVAGNRRVTDPSPRTINGAMDLMRLHRPSHLKSTRETNESGVDIRSASPSKAEGGKDWPETYRDRRSKSVQDH